VCEFGTKRHFTFRLIMPGMKELRTPKGLSNLDARLNLNQSGGMHRSASALAETQRGSHESSLPIFQPGQEDSLVHPVR